MAGEPEDRTTPETPSAAAGRRRFVNLPTRYRLEAEIGEGGMGRVYRAYDTTLGRAVAIKVIETDLPGGPDKTMQRERFVREARAAARLVHPNIVAVHDVDPDAGWLVMDLVEGETLRALAQAGPIDAKTARLVAEQVLSALVAAHAAGVIHRDIKPSNIMLGPTGKVTLVDFGVARLTDAELTRTGDSLGTPAYMAPEQIRGAAVDARTDLYGLGATLYEVVTGKRMIAFEPPPDVTSTRLVTACSGDRGLARTIDGCLRAEPEARFASAQDALVALAGGRAQRARSGGEPGRWSLRVVAAVAGVAVLAGSGVWYARHRTPADPRYEQAFTLAQRGENERASEVLESYLIDHPTDADALEIKFLAEWWQGGTITDVTKRTVESHLRPEQRAMVRGIDLICQRRETEAIGYLEGAERETPDAPEVLYALGEARWHGQRLEDGAATLERAFLLDPRWEMALHHVVEFRLSRGEARRLEPIANKLRAVDPGAAAALDCKIAIGTRDYAGAVASAQAARGTLPPTPELEICLAQAQALAGELDASAATAKTAFEMWPIDLREWGGFAQHAESYLYRGDLEGYLVAVGSKPSRQRNIALALWRPDPSLQETTPAGSGMRMPPLGAATWILVGQTEGRDEVAVYGVYPEPEVAAYGKGLWAETRGDRPAAIAAYRHALEVPQKGDMRMLVGHHLARALDATGDHAGAAAVCQDEVIAPRMYQDYRAVLLPDCLLWSGDRTRWQQLVTAWTGSFEHPAVREAKRRLEQK